MKEIRCRLAELIWQKHLTAQALAENTGIPQIHIERYCDDAFTAIDVQEVLGLLEALDLNHLSDVFDVVNTAPDVPDAMDEAADEWHSRCAAASDGKHDWFRDADASNSVYQEYECRFCKRRIHLIW